MHYHEKTMKKLIVPFFNFILCVFVLLFLIWIATWKSVHISKIEFSSSANEHRSINLPFSGDFVGHYTVTANIENISSTTKNFRVIPDDELIAIRVNGENISLNNISINDRRNYSSGFLIELEKLKANETNRVEFDIINDSNPTGFRLEATKQLSKNQFLAIFITLSLFALFLSRLLKISKLQFVCLLIGLLVFVIGQNLI